MTTGLGKGNFQIFNGARVAQSVEQRIENPRVGGSIPSLATMRINELN